MCNSITLHCSWQSITVSKSWLWPFTNSSFWSKWPLTFICDLLVHLAGRVRRSRSWMGLEKLVVKGGNIMAEFTAPFHYYVVLIKCRIDWHFSLPDMIVTQWWTPHHMISLTRMNECRIMRRLWWWCCVLWAGGRRRRPNLGLVCFVYYCVICIA